MADITHPEQVAVARYPKQKSTWGVTSIVMLIENGRFNRSTRVCMHVA